MWIPFIRFTNVAIFMAVTPPVWWNYNLDQKTLSDDLGLAVSSVTRLNIYLTAWLRFSSWKPGSQLRQNTMTAISWKLDHLTRSEHIWARVKVTKHYLKKYKAEMVKDESDKNPHKRVFTFTSRVSPLRNSCWTIFIARKGSSFNSRPSCMGS